MKNGNSLFRYILRNLRIWSNHTRKEIWNKSDDIGFPMNLRFANKLVCLDFLGINIELIKSYRSMWFVISIELQFIGIARFWALLCNWQMKTQYKLGPMYWVQSFQFSFPKIIHNKWWSCWYWHWLRTYIALCVENRNRRRYVLITIAMQSKWEEHLNMM